MYHAEIQSELSFVSVADNDSSAPSSAQNNLFNGRGPGSIWGAGAPACHQPPALPLVFTTTDQKLSQHNG